MSKYTVTIINNETGEEIKESLDAVKVLGVVKTEQLPTFLTDGRHHTSDIIWNHIEQMNRMPAFGTVEIEIAVKWPLELLEGQA